MLPAHASNAWRTARRWRRLTTGALAALALLLAAPPASAVQRGTVSVSVESGFARLVFEFDEALGHETTIANNVLVMTLDTEVEIDLSGVVAGIPGYVAAARVDPDRTTLRFALSRPMTVSTIAARERLYVDLLPAGWAGPPPGLPEEVVAELIQRAEEEAARAAARGRRQDAGQRLLEVHVGRYPTFSRIAFDWAEPTKTVLSREGDIVSLTFDREVEADITRLKVDPPPQLVSAVAQKGEGTVTVTLEVEHGTDVRGFREGQTYVVDLASQAPGVPADGEATMDSAQLAPALPPIPVNSEEIRVSGTESGNDEPQPADNDLVEITVSPLEFGAAPGGESSGGEDVADAEVPSRKADAIEDGGALMADSAMDEEGEDATAMVAIDPDAPVVVGARLVGSTLRLTFPFAEPVASAAFQRARTLWVVFDSGVEIDTAAIAGESGDMVGDVELVDAGETQVLKLSLTGEFLATSNAQGNRWIVSIGDMVLAPTEPLALERALRVDGLPKVSVALPGGGRVHWLADEAIGDTIAVVTLFGPPRGLIKRQEFVEFTALPTVHGLAIRPHADDLAVRLAQDEVVITRVRGLNISAGRWPLQSAGEAAGGDSTRPGYVDFVTTAGDGTVKLRRRAQDLTRLLSEAPPERRASLRQQLARLYLSYGLGIEALGVMQLAEEEDPEVVNDSDFHAMRGIALTLAGRLEQAHEDLLSFQLAREPHIALWRGTIEVAHENWREALDAMALGAEALDAYPMVHQARFRLAAARAGLEAGEFEIALRHLDALAGAELSDDAAARRDLLAARLAEVRGDADDAMKRFTELSVSPVRPVAAEAELRRVSLFLRSGRMTSDAAIAALEGLQVAWRGDNIELAVVRKLAELYAGAGRYREALEAMKAAIVNHEDNQRTRLIADDMTSLFNRLYLDGDADELPPIAALGLYYDFRELTPVGRRGDEMIRKLADRLVAVDLLDQAADLLDHQVTNRLTGVARAQVAAELSLIYLLSHKPDLALKTIRQTRQAVLPDKLQNRRNILEARALADLGRVELAIEILGSMTGETIERLKANALWRGERWLAAGEQFERILGARWQQTAPLDDTERLDVLRAGIAYALANDMLGLERLRRKYVSKMSSSPDSNAFNVVTGGIERNAGAVNELARKLSGIDSMEGLLEEMRDQNNDNGDDGLGGTSSPGADAAS